MRRQGKSQRRRGADGQAAELTRLAGLIQAVEGRSPGRDAKRLISTGWTATSGRNRTHGESGAISIPTGTLHEWFGVETTTRTTWVPPMGIMTHLAWRTLESVESILDDPDAAGVVWIGRRVWPHGRWLVRRDGRDRSLLERSLLIDPPREAGRLWAIDLAARCPAVVSVVADGRNLDMAATRRLQLAAEAGGTLMLLVRPPWEIHRRSAAATRWCVRRVQSPTGRPRWDVELVRCKGMHALLESGSQDGARKGRVKRLEWDREQGAVVTSADVVDRPDPPARVLPAAIAEVARRSA